MYEKEIDFLTFIFPQEASSRIVVDKQDVKVIAAVLQSVAYEIV